MCLSHEQSPFLRALSGNGLQQIQSSMTELLKILSSCLMVVRVISTSWRRLRGSLPGVRWSVRMQCPPIIILSETDMFDYQTACRRGQKTNKSTSRAYAKMTFQTPRCPIPGLPPPLPMEPNGFFPPKTTHPPNCPESQSLTPERHGTNTKIYSMMKQIRTIRRLRCLRHVSCLRKGQHLDP